MKLYSLKCPSCGASISFDPKKPIKFCSYCGDQIIFDDGVKRSEHKSYKYSEHVVRDEAKILEAKNQLELSKEETKRKRITILNDAWPWLLFFGICGIMYLAGSCGLL